MLSAEVAPFVTVGGLSQVNYFLSKALLRDKHDVRIFTPFYGKINHKKYKTETIATHIKYPQELQDKKYPASIEWNIRAYKHKPLTYFVENREYFTLREHVFGYGDDHQRFYLLCVACLEWLCQQIKTNEWVPDIVHAQDWHAGYFLELARTVPKYKELMRHIGFLFTVHNFRYQGNFDFTYLPPNEKDVGTKPLLSILDPAMQRQNALLRGIMHADWINTVSQTHAIEVLTSQYGEGLEDFLLQKRGVFSGVINGLDTKTFDPGTDPLVSYNFTISSLGKRKNNKLILQKEFNLPQDPTIPLLSFVGRLDKQKGLHLILEILPVLIQELNIQFIVLGGGDQQFAREFYEMQKKFPKNIGTHLYANFKLPRKIIAGSDCMLLPSMFEPGGIVALEAMRYGSIPIVHKTGGLADIVNDFDPKTKKGNGFSFVEPKPSSLLIAITRAMETYRNPNVWKVLISNVMKEDFSWDHSMKEYVLLYKKIQKIRRQSLSSNPSPAFQI